VSVSQTEPTDQDGCVIPASEVALYDFLAEFPFDIEDEDYDACEWPCWTDLERWELGPRPEPEPFHPSDEDWQDYVMWLDRQEALEALEDAYRRSEWNERRERAPLGRDDDDRAASGLAVG
jgi:hypothetical protein